MALFESAEKFEGVIAGSIDCVERGGTGLGVGDGRALSGIRAGGLPLTGAQATRLTSSKQMIRAGLCILSIPARVWLCIVVVRVCQSVCHKAAEPPVT